MSTVVEPLIIGGATINKNVIEFIENLQSNDNYMHKVYSENLHNAMLYLVILSDDGGAISPEEIISLVKELAWLVKDFDSIVAQPA